MIKLNYNTINFFLTHLLFSFSSFYAFWIEYFFIISSLLTYWQVFLVILLGFIVYIIKLPQSVFK